MKKIKIITDSTCDLSPELIKKNNISVLPLMVNFKESSYRDGIDITTSELYDKVSSLGYLPKTSAVTPGRMIEEFEKWLSNGYEIIFTGISSKMSRTYENALLARATLDQKHIYVVDSGNLSSGIGLLVLYMSKLRDDGYESPEIVKKSIEKVSLIRSQFVIDRFDYLYKGGRCSGMAKIFGTVLKIKPIICVRNKEMNVGKKPHGKLEKGLDSLLDMLKADRDNIDVSNIMVTDSVCPNGVSYLTKKIKEILPSANIIHTNAGCVISSHCGKGTVGILYMKLK